MKDAFSWDSIPVKTGATADPAAGANLANITVPAGKRWLLLAAYCSVVMDATVVNRYLQLNIRQDGTNPTGQFYSTGMAASGTYYLSEVPGIGTSATAVAYISIGFGLGWELSSGAVVNHTMINLQAGDDIGVMRYAYKEAPA